MIVLLTLFVSSALSVSCSTYEIPEFNTYVTLPASGDGYGISSISHKEVRIPKAKWDKQRKAAVILLAEDYAKIKYSMLKNCMLNECKQTVGALDGLFGAIDSALKLVPR